MGTSNIRVKTFFAFSLLMATCCVCAAQYPTSTSINVSSKFYNGKRLMLILGSPWMPNEHHDFKFVDTTQNVGNISRYFNVAKEKSRVEVVLNYPHPFGVAFFDTTTQSGSGSQIFFVGKGKVDVSIDDFTKNNSKLNGQSKLNREYLKLQRSYKNHINEKTKETKNLAGKLDVIKKYVSKNPNSYVALWDLVFNYQLLEKNDQKRKVLDIVQIFSNKLKDTKTSQALVNALEQDLQLINGVSFPNLFLEGSDSLYALIAKKKYTLVDFWFSDCVPCMKQFPVLKELYDDNKERGFEIVAFSVDSNADQWKESIIKNQLKWVQQLDESRMIANALFIRKYPTNYLIDHTGKIIEVDIKPEALREFLKINL